MESDSTLEPPRDVPVYLLPMPDDWSCSTAALSNLPVFCSGERIGSGSSPEMEIAVDPLDGTTLISQAGHRSCSFQQGPEFNSIAYMYVVDTML